MKASFISRSYLFILLNLFLITFCQPVNAESSITIDQKIDEILEPAAGYAESIVFWSIPIGDGKAIPLVLVILGSTALFLTIYFRFINFRAIGVAARTIKGK